MKQENSDMLRIVIVAALLGIVTAADAEGQSLAELERSRYSPAAYYNYSEAGDVTILVSVWGAVQNPGLYQVPVGTRLGTILSLAGGPAGGQQSWNQRRRTTIRLIRDQEGVETTIFESVMQDEVYVPAENPELVNGDVLTVELYTKQLFTWRDALSIVSAGASFALLIDRMLSVIK